MSNEEAVNLGKPVIEKLFTGYKLTWGNVIRAKAEACKIHSSDGRLTADVTIDVNVDGKWMNLMSPAIMNLSSATTRKKQSKDLAERMNSYDWIKSSRNWQLM